MSTLHEAIRAQLDNYATGDPSDGDHGDFQRDHAAPELFAAVRNILDYADGLGEPFAGSTYGYVAAALGVSTEPAQPTRQWAVEHPSWETVVHHSIGSALYTLDHPPLGDRARLVTRMSDQTEWVPCGRDGEPVSARPRSCGLYVGPGQNCIEPVEVDGKCRTHAAQDTADVPAWARRHPHKTPAQRLLEASTVERWA